VKKTLALLMIVTFVGSSAYAMDMSKHIGFGGWVGGNMPLHGDFSSDPDIGEKMGDFVGFYGFPAVEVKYVVMDRVSVALNGGYGYMPVKDDKKPQSPAWEDMTPALNLPYVTVNGTFNFGPMMKAEDNKLNPFATAGVGMYMWYFSVNERSEKIGSYYSGEEFKGTSLGLNVGGGVEYFAMEKLAVFGRVNYHYVMMKDEDKFGEDFGNQGFLMFGAGVTYYLALPTE
jgi:opacity protein-like surface antigen